MIKIQFMIKCRCMNSFNQRMRVTNFMSGTWKVHNSLSSLLYPYGLHRVSYMLKDNDLDNLFNDDGFIKVTCRNSSRLNRFKFDDFYIY